MPAKPHAQPVALVNGHAPDGVSPAFVKAGDPIPDSWRVKVGAAADYVEHLIATGGAGTLRQWHASELHAAQVEALAPAANDKATLSVVEKG
jgi:hypothetical protein